MTRNVKCLETISESAGVLIRQSARLPWLLKQTEVPQSLIYLYLNSAEPEACAALETNRRDIITSYLDF